MRDESKSFSDALRLALLWLPPLVYMVAIFWMSSRSNPIPGLRLVGGTDKIAHAAAYALLAFLFARALAGTFPKRSLLSMASSAALIATAYGALDEFHQTFVPGRHGCIWDAVADGVGALLGASSFLLLCRVLEYTGRTRGLRSGAAVEKSE